MKRAFKMGLFISLLAFITLTVTGCISGIDNPYEGVDWGAPRYIANFHAHTNESDGIMTPAQVIDGYRYFSGRNYRILALSDHDFSKGVTTWPWTDYGRDPAALGMAAIESSEISTGGIHHIVSLFNDYAGKVSSEDTALKEIAQRNGIAFFAHPRWTRTTHVSWYVDLYLNHDNLIGQEVVNTLTKAGHPGDEQAWDQVLYELMPDRPVWGFANDDLHSSGNMGYSYNVIPLNQLSASNVRAALENGGFYFCNVTDRTRSAPEITSISVDQTALTITINATNYQRIEWITDGNIVHTGNQIKVDEVSGISGYVRARIVGQYGMTYTQPFGMIGAIKSAKYSNPVNANAADPSVIEHNGVYYLYSTGGGTGGAYPVWTSTDLVNWTSCGNALAPQSQQPIQYGVDRFWAPEVTKYNNKFYMVYSAGGSDGILRICVAEADNPLGPFLNIKAPLWNDGKNYIDGMIFIDDDQTPYLYYVSDRHGGISQIWVQRMSVDLKSLLGSPVLVATPLPEENTWNEGPYVIKNNNNGKYYLTYSACYWGSRDYKVGYCRADHPLGPWTKISTSILKTDMSIGVSGPGHNSFVRTSDGQELFVVYHSHRNHDNLTAGRQANIDRAYFDSNGALVIEGPKRTPRPMPSEPPRPDPVPHKYDMGTDISPLASGYTKITHATRYIFGSYGWKHFDGIQSRDRSSGTDLRRDFVFNSAPRSFVINLPNQTYTVKVTQGDATIGHDKMAIKANGAVKASNINTSPGQWVETTFQVDVTNGVLELEFLDEGGTDLNWVVNAIEII